MANLSQVRTNRPLTNVSLNYSNDGLNFLHTKLSPTVNVVLDSADIYSYGTDNLRITNSVKSKGGVSTGIDWSVSKAAHYKLEKHKIHTYITEEDYRNHEKPIEPQRDAVEMLTETLMIAKEYSLASAMQSTSTMTLNTTLTGTDQWNDYTNSDPIDDIKTGIIAVKNATGKLPNTLVLAWDTLLTLQYHPKIKDMFPGAPQITDQMLRDGISKIFPGITRLEVGMAMYNSANKGASLDLAEIWTKTAIVAYIEPRPKLKSRSLSYTYQHGTPRQVQFIGQNGGDRDLADREEDYISVKDEYDQILVDVNCGYLIKSAIA